MDELIIESEDAKGKLPVEPIVEECWPYGTPVPRRLIEGFKALDAIYKVLSDNTLTKASLTDLKVNDKTKAIHESDLKDTLYYISAKRYESKVEEVARG
jgi:hypothetical protein